MKKILLFLCLLLLVAGCASLTVGSRQLQPAVEPPVYLTGNNEPAAFAVSSRQSPVYYTGNDEPAAMGMFRYSDEQ